MGRCKYELLIDLEPALDTIRKLEGLVEKSREFFIINPMALCTFTKQTEKFGLLQNCCR